MPAGRYPFIPFLRTKSQKRQTKNRDENFFKSIIKNQSLFGKRAESSMFNLSDNVGCGTKVCKLNLSGT